MPFVCWRTVKRLPELARTRAPAHPRPAHCSDLQRSLRCARCDFRHCSPPAHASRSSRRPAHCAARKSSTPPSRTRDRSAGIRSPASTCSAATTISAARTPSDCVISTPRLADDGVDAVWCVRGGYGAMRLLPHIDWASLTRRPRALLGFSDVTALHAAASTRCELITYHAPTARVTLSDFSRASLVRAVVEGRDSCGLARRCAHRPRRPRVRAARRRQPRASRRARRHAVRPRLSRRAPRARGRRRARLPPRPHADAARG